jgi:uncharacterized membrane protein required for colicin V production
MKTKVVGFVRGFLSVALSIAGIVGGIYVGFWLFFIGGIVQIINEVKSTDTNAMIVALGVAKIVFAGLAGGLTAIIGISTGYIIGDVPFTFTVTKSNKVLFQRKL